MATLNEKLKEILGEQFTADIETKLGNYGKHVVYLWNKDDEKEKDREAIPKFRVNEMLETSKSKVTALEGQIITLENQGKEYDKQLKELKKAADGNADLVKQISDLQESNKTQKETFETEKVNLTKKEVELKKSFALKEHLLNAGVGDVTARDFLSKNFDTNKIEVGEDGKIKGFDELLKPIKENKAFEGMFGETKSVGQRHIQGDIDLNGDFFTREQISSMSLDQMKDPKVLDKVNKSLANIK